MADGHEKPAPADAHEPKIGGAVAELLTVLSKIPPAQLAHLTAVLAANPEAVLRRFITFLVVGPTPIFTKPVIPFSITLANARMNGVTVAFKANVYHAYGYTLVLYKDGNPVGIIPQVRVGGGLIPNTQIDIPAAGSPDYTIVGSNATFPGTGDYYLKITANLYPPHPLGFGTMGIEINVM